MNVRKGFGSRHVARALCGLFTLIGIGIALPAHAAIPASERQVLLDIYTSTNGQSWTDNSGWNGAPGSECSWFGITCDGSGAHVTEIDLAANNLTGSLPSLAGLINLTIFNAATNLLTGSIPSLAGLTNLQTFFVGGNQLTGSIPSLAGLTNLAIFIVGTNQLSGPLPSLAGLANLQVFGVGGNQLSGSIPSLAGLANLQAFAVGLNQLAGSIPSLAGLTNLQYFDVGFNQLSGNIPDVPSPDNLADFGSAVCPNALNQTPNAAWDAATGITPWYRDCTPLPDPIFGNGFDPPDLR